LQLFLNSKDLTTNLIGNYTRLHGLEPNSGTPPGTFHTFSMKEPDAYATPSLRKGGPGADALAIYTKNILPSAGGMKSAGLKSARMLGMNPKQAEPERVAPKPAEKRFESLYERTMSLLAKLYSIPDFEFYLFPDGVEALVSGDAPPVIDPIAILWHCFRLGAPLCHLLNQLQPVNLLGVPDVSQLTTYTNICKKCIFHFLIAVKEQLGVNDDALFSISELYNDDMNKLVKVFCNLTRF
jgi:hypothetical protein